MNLQAFQDAHHFVIENFYAVDDSRRREVGSNLLVNSACLAASHVSKERSYDLPKCHPGTRRAVIEEIMVWVNSKLQERRIMWLSGPAGAGKSSIAQTIAERCDEEGKLVSSFFFSRTDTSAGRDDGGRLIPTIAYHISIIIPETQDIILTELEQNPAILSQSMKQQLQRLVLEPLQCVMENNKDIRTAELVIVDGLDECNDLKTQIMIIQVLAWVTSQTIRLRFLIASRPELEIRNTFDSRTTRDLCTRIVLDDHYAPNDDIAIYLRSEFDRIKDEHTLASELSEDWPSEHDIWKLVEKSSGQFIYASTIIKYIGDERRDPEERLRAVIDVQPNGSFNESPYAELDAVYTHILENAVRAHGYGSVSFLFMVLLYAKDTGQSNPYFLPSGGAPRVPLKPIYTFPRLSIFLGISARVMKLYFADLYSVMNIPNSLSPTQDGHLFRFFHASFGDFLKDSERSKSFFIAKEKAHVNLAKFCFTAIIQSDPAIKLGELDENENQSHVLLYAFHAYFYHLHQSEFDEELLKVLLGQENLEELVHRIILNLTSDEIEDILFYTFRFDFSAHDGKDFAIPAMTRLRDICSYISHAVDDYVLADATASFSSRKAIHSFVRTAAFPEILNEGELYYCWQAIVQEDSTRAKQLFLDNNKHQDLFRDVWDYPFSRFESSEVSYAKGDVWEILSLEYFLRKIQPSNEFKSYLCQILPALRHIVALLTEGFDNPPNEFWNGWSRNMDRKTVNLSKEQWLKCVEMLELSIQTHLEVCDSPQLPSTVEAVDHKEDKKVDETNNTSSVAKPKSGFLRTLRNMTKNKIKK